MKVKLADQSTLINAQREMVFQMLSAIGKGSRLPGAQGESSRVLEREGDTLIAEFLTTSGKHTYRTVERLQLYPPERMTYLHLEGPLHFAEEEFTLTERDAGTELQYNGRIEYRFRWMPGVGWLIATFYAKRIYDTIIRDHMEKIKAAAESRAARSHEFRRPT